MSPTSTSLNRRDWLWLLLLWAITAATLLWRVRNADPFFADTDDAMRMVVVRDFLHGQNWFDLVQHRLNTPYGAEIHWSRLIDVPLAALLGLLSLFTSEPTAMIWVGAVWPLLLLAVLLWLSARITIEIVGREGLLPALVLPVLSPVVLAEFNPGRVDHHNVVIVLMLALLLASLVSLRRPAMAWLAGLLAGTSLAIAVEALPVAVAAILGFGLVYVIDPRFAGNLRRFGLGFALGTAGHLMLARPPARWLEAACDMISPVFALAALAVGAAYLIVSLLPAPKAAWQRLGLLAVLGGAAGAVVLLVYPQCLAGPYGNLDPWLQRNWIANIVEAKPWHESLFELPAYSITVGLPVLLGTIAALVALWRHPAQRPAWLMLLAFIAATFVVMLAQIRGARLAILPIVPAAAWLIVVSRHAYLARPRLKSALALVGSWLLFTGIILSTLVGGIITLMPESRAQTVTAARASKAPCLASDSFADLRGMPPERIMSPIDLGAHLLLETPHAVVAAPYHRNEDGVLDAFRFLSRPSEEAHEIAKKRGLGLFVTCEEMPEMQAAGLNEPNTVLSLLAAGTPPDWLEDVSLGGPLKVYAILP